MMRVMNVSAAVGGVGCTTLLVQLAEILHRRGHAVAILDAHPQNAVGLHLGMEPRYSDGWFVRQSEGADPLAAALETPSGLAFLPFGRPDDTSLASAAGAGYLQTCLQALQGAFEGWLLVDAPPRGLAHAAVLRHVCTLDLHVIRADAQCLAAAGELPEGSQHAWVLNQFEPMQPLQVDMQRIWLSLLGPRLLPELVHRDRLVSEAFAAAEPLAERAKGSRVLHDLQGLAQRVELWWQSA